jgi:thioredoxin reductase (NADPH)
VVITTGVSYRRLEASGVDDLIGAGVFYGAAAVSEGRALQGEDVFMVGAGNSAGQAAVQLARGGARVTLLVRGGSLAKKMSAYLIRELDATANITVRLNTRVVEARGDHRLEELVLEDLASHRTQAVPAGALFVLIGTEPHTQWLAGTVARDAQGYVLTGRDLDAGTIDEPQWPLERAPLLLETSLPGVFAAGDVRHRSMKRVAAATGEGATSIQLVHEYLDAV